MTNAELADRFKSYGIYFYRGMDDREPTAFTDEEREQIIAALRRSKLGRSADPEFEHCAPDTQGTWQERCAALYQVVGCMAHMFGIFETSDDVSDALDVAAGRGDVEKLLPWPKVDLRQPSSDKVLRIVKIVVQLEYSHWLRNGSAIKVEDAPLVLLDVQHALAAEAEGHHE